MPDPTSAPTTFPDFSTRANVAPVGVRTRTFWSLSNPVLGIFLTACSWTAVLLIINRALFHLRLIETGDLATILYQVRDAQRFHELLGNYSRWLFHHPGPAFLYVLALGDGIFRGVLHVCPEPANAAFLTMLFLNVALLFGAIRVFARHCRSNLFLPAAGLASLMVIYVINRTNSPIATMDVWLPHMLLYVFLLFLTLCASVATGEVKDLPMLLACAGLLVHGHVAQVFFVTVLGVCSLLGLYLSRVRAHGWKAFVVSNGKPLLWSLALVVVFSAPVLLDRALDHPNNVHKIRTYLAQHRGERNSYGDSLKYELSFFLFTPNPETAIPASSLPQMLSAAAAQPYIVGYWLMVITLAGATLALWKKSADRSAFWAYSGLQLVMVCLLFFYWARRITGPLYNFNGFFFYSVQFIAVLLLIAIILDTFRFQVRSSASIGLACAVPLLMFSTPVTFERIATSPSATSVPQLDLFAREAERIAQAVPRQQGRIRMRFPGEDDDWALAAAVASRLHWNDQPVCFDEGAAAIWFEGRDVCRHVGELKTLTLTPTPRATECTAPCQLLFRDDAWSAELEPFPSGKVPFQIDAAGNNSLNLDFYDPEGGWGKPTWSKKRSIMRFLLSSDWNPPGEARVRVNGIVVKGRVVRLVLNGEPVGTIEGDGVIAREFLVPAKIFNAGRENELAFDSDSYVGVKLISVQFETTEASE